MANATEQRHKKEPDSKRVYCLFHGFVFPGLLGYV